MSVVVQGRVVLNGLVVECDEVLSCRIGHFLRHLILEFLDSVQDRLDLHVLNRLLSDLTFHNHALLLEFCFVGDAFLLEIAHNHRDAVVRILVHGHVEDPGFAAVDAAPVHGYLVIRCQAVVYFLEGYQAAPCLQLGNIFNLCVGLEDHEVVLGDDEVDIDHLLAHLARLLSLLSHLHLHFLLAGEHLAVPVVEPYHHVVI